MKRTLTLLLVLVLALGVVACGGSTNSNALVGKWAAKVDGETPGETDAALEGINVDTGIVFEADGKGHFYFTMPELPSSTQPAGTDSKVGEFTYKVSGDKITMESEIEGKQQSSTSTYKIEGETLTITNEFGTQVFTRTK